ncbi:hypothetical protein FOL47_000315 [Perkinsus chesapeaki]|uniref:ATP-dependent DNA helicase n=1 Tax=Perkinsus chesapeaki TaxID=330153 RepID=A0A7J6KW48_PERCH|nr:hypothetical protein FOL47_000315 [Perkinsus chesapeaki]
MSYFGLKYERSGKVGDNAFMRYPRELAARILESLSAAKRRDLLSGEAFLIVDEVGIVHDTILDGLSQALKTLRKEELHGDRPFGGIVTVLLGDPCQLRTINLFEESSDFPPKEFPTGPFWKSMVWQEMDPKIAYLTKFHRGESDDDYLQLLSEIRSAEEIIPGVPRFSQKSLQVLQDIRDRDAGNNPPRFDHTIICLTNAEADKYNERHLASLPGDAYIFGSIDQAGEQEANLNGIDMEAVSKMGYRPVVKLKDGCKVMATINDPLKRFVNGLTGKVVGIRRAGGSESVVVKFDGTANNVEVERYVFTVEDKDGNVIFSRRQFPLMISYALTCHKTQGCTLDGVWAKLPFARVPKSSNHKIAALWSQDWLRGSAYTMLSRVGSRDKIRVFPLRNVKSAEDLNPIFFMDPQARAFDKDCMERSWLRTGQVNAPPIHQTQPPQPSSEEAHPSRGDTLITVEDIQRLEDKIGDVLESVNVNNTRWVMLQHFEARRPSHGSGETFTNPVFYCWTKPSLRERIILLPADCQLTFYERLYEHLNITRDTVSEEQILDMICEVDNETQRQKRPLTKRVDDASHIPCTLPVQPSSAQQSVPNDVSDDPEQPAPSSPTSPQNVDEPMSTQSDSDDSPIDVEEVQAEGSAPLPRREGFDREPFLIFRGTIRRVVEKYLEENAHLRLTGCSIDSLHEGPISTVPSDIRRKTCVLLCKRAIPPSLVGKEPSTQGRPDWRSWPEAACPMTEVLVKSSGELCYLYGKSSGSVTKEQWRSHQHPHRSYTCHSRYLPPEIADDWCKWMSTCDTPTITMSKLIERTNKKNMEGAYSPTSMRFIAEGKMNYPEKLRGAYRSISEHGKSGLSVDTFLSDLNPVMHTIGDDFAAAMLPVLESLRRVKGDLATTGDHDRVRAADNCIAFSDVLCETDDLGKLSNFCLVLSSCRMLGNLENCVTIGLDASFNLLCADLAVCVICNLRRGSTALPVALAIIRRESTASVHHCLRVLAKAAEVVGLVNWKPREAVLDGSPSLHRGLKEALGDNIKTTSCYFHVIKRAKDCKGRTQLDAATWRAVRNDLKLMASSWSRVEWSRLRDLFCEKWNEIGLSNSRVKAFLKEFRVYLKEEEWRSYWARHACEQYGPRTNNAVERFNREMKDRITIDRRPRTLSNFASFVKNPPSWAGLSQYGRATTRGQITRDLRRQAAKDYVGNNFMQVPRTWASSVASALGKPQNQWIFSRKADNTGPNLRENEKAKRLLRSEYRDLKDAHKLHKSFCIVSYTTSSNPDLPAPAGPWCSCDMWAKNDACSHVACTVYAVGGDGSEEAQKQWNEIFASFDKPARRRGEGGRYDTQELTETVRYGLNRHKRKPQEMPESEPSGKRNCPEENM